jgi:hypothetical protein
MTAKSAAQRKAEQRERDRLSEEERLARLLSRRITLDLFKGTDACLVQIMERIGVDEPQDAITRLIHGCAKLDDEALSSIESLT